MYTFVADKLDVVYLSAIPENHALQDFDVPEEELEIREIVEVWYECAFCLISISSKSTSQTKRSWWQHKLKW